MNSQQQARIYLAIFGRMESSFHSEYQLQEPNPAIYKTMTDTILQSQKQGEMGKG